MRFIKAHAYGNDFLYVEQTAVSHVPLDRLAREICDRHTGVGDTEVAAQPLLFEVGACEIDRRAGNVDPGDVGAALRKPGEVDAGAAPDLENAAASVSVKADETRQVMKLLEVILIEVVEESARPDGMTRDLEIVDVLIPVRPNVVYRRHGQHYTIAAGLNGPR